MNTLNTSHFGCCLELIPKLIPDKSIDMILADLPYGKTRNKWDIIIPFEPLWNQYNRIIKDNGVIVLFADQPFTSDLIQSNRKMFRYSLVWEKSNATGHLNSGRMPLRAHEDICVFYKKLPIYNPQKTTGHKRKVSLKQHGVNCKTGDSYGKFDKISYDSTERYPRSVLKFPSDKQKRKGHPTAKPIALLEYLIKTYTNPGMTVLDSVAGSGGVGEACINTERNYILIDKYFKIEL